MNRAKLCVALVVAVLLAPVTLAASIVQDLPDPTSSDPLEMALGLLFPVLIALATRYGYEGLQKAITVIDKFPAGLKPFVAVGIAVAINLARDFLGIELPGTLGEFTPQLVMSIFSGLAATGWHFIESQKAKRSAGG